jgi:SigmaK-factor processing regulatory protein BofA
MGKISLLGIIVVALVLMYLVGIFAFGAVGLLGALIINTVVGFILLYIANLIGIKIPINVLTILLVVVFGLLGLAILALLALVGIYDADTTPSTKS